MPWKNGNPPLYTAWRDMLDRCYRKTRRQYKDYGGRGITVCSEWRNSYHQFFADMWPTYKKGLTLDRRENDGNYNKDNCHWATRKEQQRNRRNTIWVTIRNKKYLAVELAEISGQKTDTIVERAKAGLPYEKVISKKRRQNLEGFKQGAAISAAVRNARTHCKHGHEYTPKNTKMVTQGIYTWRTCRACHAAKTRRQAMVKRETLKQT